MRHLPDVLAVIGTGLIVAGVAMMHVPSAFVLGGATTVFAAYLIDKKATK